MGPETALSEAEGRPKNQRAKRMLCAPYVNVARGHGAHSFIRAQINERRCPRWYGGEPFADGEGELPFQDDVEGEYAVYLQVKVACTPTLHVR